MQRPVSPYNNYSKNNDTRTNSCDHSESNSTSNKDASSAETRDICSDSPIFEIFGIKLYFDDLLLISLIFFLYSEGVKDQSLFIALVLLLLS